MSRGWIRNLTFRRPDVGSAFSLLDVHRLDELQVRTQSMEVAIANGQQIGQADLDKLCSVSGSRNAAQRESTAREPVPSTGTKTQSGRGSSASNGLPQAVPNATAGRVRCQAMSLHLNVY